MVSRANRTSAARFGRLSRPFLPLCCNTSGFLLPSLSGSNRRTASLRFRPGSRILCFLADLWCSLRACSKRVPRPATPAGLAVWFLFKLLFALHFLVGPSKRSLCFSESSLLFAGLFLFNHPLPNKVQKALTHRCVILFARFSLKLNLVPATCEFLFYNVFFDFFFFEFSSLKTSSL